MKKLFFLFAGLAMICLASCNKDNEPKNFENITLKVGETYTIKDGADADWTSSNDFIVEVDGNVLTAVLEGEVTVKSDLGSFEVTVKATNNVVKEPCLQWFATKRTVKTFMESYSNYVIEEETETDLIYVGTGNVLSYNYEFEDNELDMSAMIIEVSEVSTDELAEFVTERYIVLENDDEDDDAIYLLSPEFDTAAVLEVIDLGNDVAYMMLYVPFEYDETRAAATDLKAIFKDRMKNVKVNGEAQKKLKNSFNKSL